MGCRTKYSSNLINILSGALGEVPLLRPMQFFGGKIRQNRMLASLLLGILDPLLMLQSKNVAVVVSLTSGVTPSGPYIQVILTWGEAFMGRCLQLLRNFVAHANRIQLCHKNRKTPHRFKPNFFHVAWLEQTLKPLLSRLCTCNVTCNESRIQKHESKFCNYIICNFYFKRHFPLDCTSVVTFCQTLNFQFTD